MVRSWCVVTLLVGSGLCGCASLPRPIRAADMEEATASRSPAVGTRAYDFALTGDDGRLVRLSDYLGQWTVLYFYPQDDTPGCVCQATEFTALLARFDRQGAQVLGVSPDTPDSHRYFRKKYELVIKLLSDPEHRVMGRYGAWVESQVCDVSIPRVVRSTFLVDPRGTIAYHWPEVIPRGHAERVWSKLSELSTGQRR